MVVPLTMPSTRWTFVTTIASRSTLITGIAAHTLASKRSCTPAAEAAAKSSAPRRATSCLFAVTTCLPRAEQLEHVRARRLEPAHHLRDDRDRGSSRDLGEVVGEHSARWAVLTLLSGLADERLDDAQPVPGRPLDVVRGFGQEAVDRCADGAVPEQRDLGRQPTP